MKRTLIPLLAALVALSLPHRGRAAAEKPVVVVVDGLVVGEWKQDRWVEAREALADSRESLPYYHVGFGATTAAGSCAGFRFSPGNGAITTTDSALQRGVFLGGRQPSVPRKVERVSLASSAHRRLIRASLEARGVKAPPVIDQAYSADLDGDGRRDLVVRAVSRTDLRPGREPRNGDFSAVFVFPENATVLTNANLAQFGVKTRKSDAAAWFNSIRAIADLDGDGVMELVVETGYELGVGGSVLRYQGGRTSALCSAMNDEP